MTDMALFDLVESDGDISITAGPPGWARITRGPVSAGFPLAAILTGLDVVDEAGGMHLGGIHLSRLELELLADAARA